MVDSPMYDRLMRLVAAIDSASALDATDDDHNAIVCGLNEANNSTYHMRLHQGFTGETGDQIDSWTDQTMKRVQGIKDSHNAAMEYYVEARRAMKHVREEAQQLSPSLIVSRLQTLLDATDVVVPVARFLGPLGEPVNALAVGAAAYMQAMVAQANAQREAASADILDRANATMEKLADGMSSSEADLEKAGSIGLGSGKAPGPSTPSVRRDIENGHLNTSTHEPGVYPGNRDTDYGRTGLRGPNSGLYPGGFDEEGHINGRAMSSPRIPNSFVTEGEPGSRLNPITDPQDLMGVDLLHTRVNGDRHANGVVGGYTPAPPTDRYHPLWGINGGPGSESALAARLGGAGALGAGALGLGRVARMGAAGITSPSGVLRVGSYGGPGYGTYSAPAQGAGAAGVKGTTGMPAAAPGTGAGRGAAPGAGGYMGGSGARTGAGTDEKKRHRRKYTPFRVDDCEDGVPPGYVNPQSQTYGSDRDISPAPRKDDGWDPRQW